MNKEGSRCAGSVWRMIITHDGDPATPEGVSHIDTISHAAQEAVKGTPLAWSCIHIAGVAAAQPHAAIGASFGLSVLIRQDALGIEPF